MLSIRRARDDDADAIVAVVKSCWADYPGCVADIDGEAPELRALATAMANRGGAAWTATADAGQVVGLVACWPCGETIWEVGKLYLDARFRGHEAGRALLAHAEDFARGKGATRLTLWSDTRFTRAHAFYEKQHFLRAGPIRALADKSHSIEFGYAKPLTGVVTQVLDVAGAASAERALADLLAACVADGASVSFLPPLPADVARSFWKRLTAQVAAGTRILVLAWVDGIISGTVTLDCDTPQNQPHRADVQKLLVHPQLRRRGVARALIGAAEAAAQAAGRTLLTLDTRADDAGEFLYRSLGYAEAGRIPGYAQNPDRSFCDTVVFYKTIAPVPI